MKQASSVHPFFNRSSVEAELDLVAVHAHLQQQVEAISTCFSGSYTATLSSYLEKRRVHQGARKQDLLPLLVNAALGEQEIAGSLPLAASWMLYLAASHMLDQAQDDQAPTVGAAIFALGMGNMALAQLDTDHDTLRDILDAFGRVMAIGAGAQGDEVRHSQIWSRQEYFQYIAGKAAAIIATGAWIGGRLATENGETLTVLKEFGLALGMAMQLSDDCLDLVEDLASGTHTLPVIEGLAMESHPDHPSLKQLMRNQSLTQPQAEAVVTILERMGTIELSRRMARAYQVQAAAAFDVLPDLALYFADYVGPAP